MSTLAENAAAVKAAQVAIDAAIVAKGDQQDKNITLGISAVAMESETDGVAGEYQWEGSAVVEQG